MTPPKSQQLNDPSVRVEMSPRRRQVLDEAARLFHDRGYMGTSMDEVAEEVGLTKGSLYHHFPSKAEILKEIYEEAVDFILSHVDRHPEDATASEVVRLLMKDVLELIRDHPYHVTVYYQEMRWLREWLPEAEADRILKKVEGYVSYVKDVIRRGVANGEFRPVDESISARVLIGTSSWAHQWFRPNGRLSLDEVAGICADIFLTGVAVGGGDAPDGHNGRRAKATPSARPSRSKKSS